MVWFGKIRGSLFPFHDKYAVYTYVNNLQKRLVVFARDTLQITNELCRNSDYIDVCKQLNRAATSVGANYAEAQGAGYRKDFQHKVRIALKEMHESNYWIELLNQMEPNHKGLIILADESNQLVRILSTIAIKNQKTLENKHKQRKDL